MSAKDKRLSIVWHTIERLAFSPAPADRGRWLTVYERALPKLCAALSRSDEAVDARFAKLSKTGLTQRKRAKLQRDFKKLDS